MDRLIVKAACRESRIGPLTDLDDQELILSMGVNRLHGANSCLSTLAIDLAMALVVETRCGQRRMNGVLIRHGACPHQGQIYPFALNDFRKNGGLRASKDLHVMTNFPEALVVTGVAVIIGIRECPQIARARTVVFVRLNLLTMFLLGLEGGTVEGVTYLEQWQAQVIAAARCQLLSPNFRRDPAV